MRRADHPLLSPSLGSHKTLSSFHYGTAGAQPKVYIQASLHADELPGMLVAHHLRQALQILEDAGQIQGEVIVVPVANPIGLAQRLDHKAMGRFELGSSENFNRHYPDFAQEIWHTVHTQLGPDAEANVVMVRKAMAAWLEDWAPASELESLRRTLVQLAFDADFVLDLHCDFEGVLHCYTEEACWPQLQALAQTLGCKAVLLATGSGGNSFDECVSGVWWKLADKLRAAGTAAPLPQACCSTTVEFRGEGDVEHALAKGDAQALLSFLQHIGVLKAKTQPTLPPALCQATPLAGSETLTSAQPGVVVFNAEVGHPMQVGDLVAEVIDPISGTTHPIHAGVAGVLYTRIRTRYIHSGGEIGKIAGNVAFRTGNLLGA
ncbi:MAG: succinylglutamate desuccinylase/aspartoacylase family protein [Rhodoferax sp.]|nr:succinylglutamate desuccinylase/aspartoacylase family protein [Rhodoferax sp.]